MAIWTYNLHKRASLAELCWQTTYMRYLVLGDDYQDQMPLKNELEEAIKNTEMAKHEWWKYCNQTLNTRWSPSHKDFEYDSDGYENNCMGKLFKLARMRRIRMRIWKLVRKVSIVSKHCHCAGQKLVKAWSHQLHIEMQSQSIMALQMPLDLRKLLEADLVPTLPGTLALNVISDALNQISIFLSILESLREILSVTSTLTDFPRWSFHYREQMLFGKRGDAILHQLKTEEDALGTALTYFHGHKNKLSQEKPDHIVPQQFQEALLYLIHFKKTMATLTNEIEEHICRYCKFSEATGCWFKNKMQQEADTWLALSL